MPIRLIDLETLHMEVFNNDETTPPYAILSHTWVHGAETNLKEMTQAAEQRRMLPPSTPQGRPRDSEIHAGLVKVQLACKAAWQGGHKYLWIDTCCIDQQSLTELSEAINSMFNWYRRAEVCYAYLSDLEAGADLETGLPGCRWFKRGWCLQELIAPKDVVFLDRDWLAVGSKLAWNTAILVSKITRIPESILVSTDITAALEHTAVSVKMSWAATRTTTRTEDVAYCLLGIFGINIPLLYGEGMNAFVRLQHEIIRQTNDLTIFHSLDDSRDLEAPWDSTYAHWNQTPYRSLLAGSPANFLGQVDAWPDSKMELYGLDSQTISFSLENAGLFIRDAMMWVLKHESGGACYGIPIAEGNHYLAKGRRRRYMILQKVGPGRFARLSSSFVVRHGLGIVAPQHDREAPAPTEPRPAGQAAYGPEAGELVFSGQYRIFEGDSYVLTGCDEAKWSQEPMSAVFGFEVAGRRLPWSEFSHFQPIDAEPRGRFDAPSFGFIHSSDRNSKFHLLGYVHLLLTPPPGSHLSKARGESFYIACRFSEKHEPVIQLYTRAEWQKVWTAYDAAMWHYKRFNTTREALDIEGGLANIQHLRIKEPSGEKGLELKISADVKSPHGSHLLSWEAYEIVVGMELAETGGFA